MKKTAGMTMDKKKVCIKTFGCQMNKYDSGVMADRFIASGYALTENPEEAGIIIFNTCSIRESAKSRLFGVVNSMKPLKRKKPRPAMGICGCVAQQEGGRLLKELPHIDVICGTRQFHNIVGLFEEFLADGGPVVRTNSEPYRDIIPEKKFTGDNVASFITALRGCGNFCSYCVVPFLRGPEVSRPPLNVAAEAEILARGGTKEICLLGQNVLAYGRDLSPPANFPGLIDMVGAVRGIERIRFLTAHPGDADRAVIEKIKNHPGVCENIHLPAQSGSDRILRLMGRGYTRGRYLEIIRNLRSEIPGIAISTDIITGFPSETEKDFSETLELLETVEFDDAFLYKYSPREGTKAFQMEDTVPEGIKKSRLEELIKTQQKKSAEKNLPLLGRALEVLVEGKSNKSPGMLYGRTRTDKNVLFEGSGQLKGSLVKVKIRKTGPSTLIGDLF